jgi:hypothetical protein
MFSCVHDEMLDSRCTLFIIDYPLHPLLGLFQRFGLGSCRGWRGAVVASLEHAHHGGQIENITAAT